MFLSGHTQVDAGGQIVLGSFEISWRRCSRACARAAADGGVGFDSVARLTIYVTSYAPGMIPVLRRVRARFVSDTVAPGSALVAVAALYDPRVRVEVDAVAVVPEECKAESRMQLLGGPKALRASDNL